MSSSTMDRRFVHDALYYRDTEEFLAGVAELVRTGFTAGVPCLVAVPQPRLNLVRDAVPRETRLVDIGVAGRNPALVLPILQAFVSEYASERVNLVCESMYAGRSAEEVIGGLRHESLTNLAFTAANVRLVCPVDVAALPHLIPYAERVHPTIVDGRGRRLSTAYTEPATMMALLDQPLPEPRQPVQSCAGLAPEAANFASAQALAAGVAQARALDLAATVLDLAAEAGIGEAIRVRTWVDAGRLICEVSRPTARRDDLGLGCGAPLVAASVADQRCDLVQHRDGVNGTVTRLFMII